MGTRFRAIVASTTVEACVCPRAVVTNSSRLPAVANAANRRRGATLADRGAPVGTRRGSTVYERSGGLFALKQLD
jgi:hypothetical protein